MLCDRVCRPCARSALWGLWGSGGRVCGRIGVIPTRCWPGCADPPKSRRALRAGAGAGAEAVVEQAVLGFVIVFTQAPALPKANILSTAKVHLDAFFPGGNADFGDPELIYLFSLADFLGKSRHYAGKKGGPEFCFSPICFPRGKTRSFQHQRSIVLFSSVRGGV